MPGSGSTLYDPVPGVQILQQPGRDEFVDRHLASVANPARIRNSHPTGLPVLQT
jgi:hypothetical protein